MRARRLHPDDIDAIARDIACGTSTALHPDDVAAIRRAVEMGLRQAQAAQAAPPDRDVSIYVLKEPDTGEVRYVGRSVDPFTRFSHHLTFDPRQPRLSAKEEWVCQLRAQGKQPVLEVVATTKWSVQRRVELEWIRRMLADGARLTNSAWP